MTTAPGVSGDGGLLLVDKSVDRTSRAVVDDLVRALGRRDIGHAGTLDPFATGLLLLLVGRGTRLVPWIHEWDKEYEAVVALGRSTDTLDRTGRVTAEAPVPSDITGRLPAVLDSLTGDIDQAPPMVSAAKVGGRRLHELARAGLEVERAPRRRTIHALEILRVDGPSVSIRVVCSSGTYVRSLAEEIGRRLDLPAHLHELRRTRIGPWQVAGAVPDAELRLLPGAGLMDRAHPLAAILDWPVWRTTPGELADIRHGRMPAVLPEAGGPEVSQLSDAGSGEGGRPPARWRVLDDQGSLAALVERPAGGPPRFLRVFIGGGA